MTVARQSIYRLAKRDVQSRDLFDDRPTPSIGGGRLMGARVSARGDAFEP
ncbi:MAG: hypothetical protein V4550_12180 [Gemmatimonadota bacterium]